MSARAKVTVAKTGQSAHLLLLHQLGVRAVVNHVPAEHGSSEDGVDLLGVDVLELAVQDKVVARGAEADRRLFAQENECEDVAILQSRAS